jgi:hypothetical protein
MPSAFETIDRFSKIMEGQEILSGNIYFPLSSIYSFKVIKKPHGGHVKSIFEFPFLKDNLKKKSLSLKLEYGNMCETVIYINVKLVKNC